MPRAEARAFYPRAARLAWLLFPASTEGKTADTLAPDFERRGHSPAMLKMTATMKYSFRCRRSRKGNILFFNNALFSLPNQTYSLGRIVENGAARPDP
jgi:hypothetical protein